MIGRSRSTDASDFEDDMSSSAREVSINGVSMKTAEVEAKLDEGNIHDAESSLREGLSLNFEEARALLGRLEYQRGNLEGALRVFEGIDLQAAIQRLQPNISDRTPSKKGRSRSESVPMVSQHAASLVLEAIYLKAKSLQKLGKLADAAEECKSVLDAVESIFYQGIPDVQVDNRLQETVSRAVELLPELWKQAGCHEEAVIAYRRALLSHWNLDSECCARIQKAFAIYLLYNGVEAGPPSLGSQIDGAYVPKNNLEESILILMILIRKFCLGKSKWDPSIVEHLTFALSLCDQTSVLAKQLEAVMPGVLHRIDRWNTLALCFTAISQNITALNLLRKSLHRHERPDDLMALLLAAKICSEDPHFAAEGAEYAQRVVDNAQGKDEHLRAVGLRMLGLCCAEQAKISSSDFERSHLQSKALKSLEGAYSLEQHNPDIIFELGVQYAEQRNLDAASRCAKKFLDATGGSPLRAWKFLALVYSAQQRYSEAEVIIDTALDETAKWEQGPLLSLKAKLKIAQASPLDAVETYRNLLALVQAQRKSYGPFKSITQNILLNEFEVWDGLANLYSSLSHWRDVEICLGKARDLNQHSAVTHQTKGVMYEQQSETQKALTSYINALLLDPSYVPCKILLAALLSKMGTSAVPVAKALLSDALRIEPTNRMAWYQMGMIYKNDGRIADATDCFLAASMLEGTDPVESFSSCS